VTSWVSTCSAGKAGADHPAVLQRRPGEEPPVPPEELALIPSVTLLATDTLDKANTLSTVTSRPSYPGLPMPHHGLGIGTARFGPAGSLQLLEVAGLELSLWDRAVGGTQLIR